MLINDFGSIVRIRTCKLRLESQGRSGSAAASDDLSRRVRGVGPRLVNVTRKVETRLCESNDDTS
jgi:hypothetical protein